MRHALLTVALASSLAATARAGLFLKIDGIPGSSMASKREDWLDVQSFGISVEVPPDETPDDPRDNLMPIVSAMHMVSPVSSSSPYLLYGAVAGETYTMAELQIVDASFGSPRVVAFWQMEPARIVSYQTTGASGGAQSVAAEQYDVTPLQFLRYGYNHYNDAGLLLGATTLEWDLVRNKVLIRPYSDALPNGVPLLMGDADAGDLIPAHPPEAFDSADFHVDGDANGGDLPLWRSDFGQTDDATADADGDGDADGADFLAWQRQLGGQAAADSSATGVPEPASLALVALAAAAAAVGRQTRRPGT